MGPLKANARSTDHSPVMFNSAAEDRATRAGSAMKIRFCRWIGVVFILLVSACGGRPKKVIVIAPEYQPEYAVVFDDVLAPQLFGFDPQGRDPIQDPKLRERTLRADLILPARVETISRVGGVENRGAYEVVLAAAGPPLFGKAPNAPLVVNVGVGGATYPWIDGAGASWVGTRLILFAKRFRTGKHNEPDVIHYRGEPDTRAMREAIHRHLVARVLPVGSSQNE
jgi:hypothetical protein